LIRRYAQNTPKTYTPVSNHKCVREGHRRGESKMQQDGCTAQKRILYMVLVELYETNRWEIKDTEIQVIKNAKRNKLKEGVWG